MLLVALFQPILVLFVPWSYRRLLYVNLICQTGYMSILPS